MTRPRALTGTVSVQPRTERKRRTDQGRNAASSFPSGRRHGVAPWGKQSRAHRIAQDGVYGTARGPCSGTVQSGACTVLAMFIVLVQPRTLYSTMCEYGGTGPDMNSTVLYCTRPGRARPPRPELQPGHNQRSGGALAGPLGRALSATVTCSRQPVPAHYGRWRTTPPPLPSIRPDLISRAAPPRALVAHARLTRVARQPSTYPAPSPCAPTLAVDETSASPLPHVAAGTVAALCCPSPWFVPAVIAASLVRPLGVRSTSELCNVLLPPSTTDRPPLRPLRLLLRLLRARGRSP